jgi:hypothetical protein
MKRIGVADHVIMVLSDKYLRSPYCMTELHYIYQPSTSDHSGKKKTSCAGSFPWCSTTHGSAAGASASLTPNTGRKSLKLWSRLLPQVQTPQHHRRYLF